jgi:hypothetical protein
VSLGRDRADESELVCLAEGLWCQLGLGTAHPKAHGRRRTNRGLTDVGIEDADHEAFPHACGCDLPGQGRLSGVHAADQHVNATSGYRSGYELFV